MIEPTPVGIDLGTTFSVVAQVAANGTPVILPNAEGSPTTPSVVLFDDGRAIVGAIAKRAIATDPDSVVQLVKRHMGSQWSFDHHHVSYRPEHVSSLVLRKVKNDASLLTGEVTRAAITVPAYFNEPMRSATRRAGELAGLEVIGLLSEPTAAAIAYGFEQRPSGTTGLVIDLGGGTFDVTAMHYDGADLVVRATGGDAYLGGANFDKVIFDRFVADFAGAHGLDINDPSALSIDEFTQTSQEWLSRATETKLTLTTRDRAPVSLQAAGLSHRSIITREQFVADSRILLDEMSEKMLDVVRSAGLTPADIDVVLAVGGSTRMPAVRQRITALFGDRVDTSVRADEMVAVGAALFAARRQLELGAALAVPRETRAFLERMNVQDVAAHSLGIPVFDPALGLHGQSVIEPLVPRNVALPHPASRTFFTRHPGATTVVVPIIEGEERDPDLCRRIGDVRITDLPPGRPAGQAVDVTMSLDRDGILEVAATDVATGSVATISLEYLHANATPEVVADAAVRALVVD